jgi:hypothetical protein
MGAAYGQLLAILREAILERLQNSFSLWPHHLGPVFGNWVLKSSTEWTTEALADVVRLAVESQGYRVVDVQSTTWFVDGLVVENNSDPFARFAVTNNTRYGHVIIVSVDPAGPER